MGPMRRAALLLAVLPALAACGERPAPPGSAAPPREEMARAFTAAMKTLDLQYENLQADLSEKRPPSDIRVRLAKIRAAVETASGLPYRASEAENRDLAFEFRKFLDAAGKLERAEWAGDEGLRAWKRLGAACASCHDLYRKDEDK